MLPVLRLNTKDKS